MTGTGTGTGAGASLAAQPGWPGEAAVLASLAAQPGRPGLDLARDTGLSSGRLYPVLVRLQRAGLIEAHWSTGRRTYRLTAPAPVQRTGPALQPNADTRDQRSLRTALLWLPAALAALITTWVALTRPPHVRLSDLAVYTGAVEGLTHGASLYDFISAGDAPFTYPPFAGLLFLPLVGASPSALQLGWTLSTLVILAGLAVVLSRHAGAAGAPSRLAPAFALALVLSAPVSSNLRFGQVSLLLAALITVDVLALRQSRWQGLLIGLAAAVKLTPLIFIPMLWLTGRRRAAVLASATFAVCAALAGLALPGDSWRFWTTEISHVSRLGHITGIGNQSLNAALLRLELSAPVRSAVVLLAGGAIAALALHRAARQARSGDWFSALVLTGAAGLVLSPVSWTHHQIWLVLAALLPVAGAPWARRAWPVLVLAVMLLPLPALGPPLWSNARLLLAVTIAVLLPLSRPARPSRSCGGAASRTSSPGCRTCASPAGTSDPAAPGPPGPAPCRCSPGPSGRPPSPPGTAEVPHRR
jgi:alpha-1,2-mannosyltransferase